MSETDEFSALIAAKFSPCLALSAEVISELRRHYELLTRWNKSLNLTSITGIEDAVERHYCESLFLGIHVPGPAISVLDIGSGGGFPGIPMAILRPDCTFTLAESHQRKAVFLREATRHLPNIRVAPCRADQTEGAFDWVVSRAVQWREVLKSARRLAGGMPSVLGLLMGQGDAEAAALDRTVSWQAPIPLPWGSRRVLLLGCSVSE